MELPAAKSEMNNLLYVDCSSCSVPAVYGSYQTTLYYAVLAAQRVSHLSAKQTAVCFPPMGGCGLILTMLLGYLIDIVSPRMLLFFGMSMAVVAPIPTSVGMHENMSLYAFIPRERLYIELTFK